METLEKKIAKLPDSLKLRVEGYIDALLMDNNITKTPVVAKESELEIKAGFGGGKGIFGYMADDFDAPLNEFKDYV